MAYKKIEPVLIEFGELIEICGLFKFNVDINNSYGCRSKNKMKGEIGSCYKFDCPLCREADLEDLKKHDAHLYEEYKKDNIYEIESDWVIQYQALINK